MTIKRSPKGEQPDPAARKLIALAALASEIYGDDELEDFATKWRRTRETEFIDLEQGADGVYRVKE